MQVSTADYSLNSFLNITYYSERNPEHHHNSVISIAAAAAAKLHAIRH